MYFCDYVFSLESLISFFNSQFVSSLVGALMGAFFGAMAAHRLSENAKDRELLESQIRSTNVAIMSSFLICNAFLAIKKQYVVEMYKTFHIKRDEYEQTLKQQLEGRVFHFEADLKIVQVPDVPIAALNKQAYECLLLKGRALGLVSAINNALTSLEVSIKLRNDNAEFFKKFPAGQDQEKLNFLFGFPMQNGNINTVFADSLEGIYKYTDDIIFFSSLLCSDLEKYGNNLREKYLKKHRGEIEPITSLSFEKAESLDLMPDKKEYEDWISAFSKK